MSRPTTRRHRPKNPRVQTVTDGGWGTDVFLAPQRGDLFGWSATDAITVDTLVRSNVTTSLAMGVGGSAGTINNSASVFFLLDAGTYRLDFIHRTTPSRGIYTVTIDDVAVGTFDGYSAGNVDNVVSSFTGVALSAGRHTVKWLMATKHASATNYVWALASVTATRTGV